MKKTLSILSAIGIAVVLLLSCGKDGATSGGPQSIPLDASHAVGNWEGAMVAINIPNSIQFNGAKIFFNISGPDSLFSLVSLDPTRDPTKYPAIRDTSLVLMGTWKLNTPQDSILLLCDTGRIVDIELNVLASKKVRGQIIPLGLQISRNSQNNDIEWDVSLADLLPLAPLLGMNLSGNPGNLAQVTIVLVKRSQ